MNDLFDSVRVTRDTSLDAYTASLERAPNLRTRIWLCLNHFGEQSADDVADRLRESVLSVRPQFTLLVKESKIAETGRTSQNKSGRDAIVWRALPESQWATAPERMTPAEKIAALRQEVLRLRALCNANGVDWRTQ
jgi:predicted ArsR family transcriptional regulator